MHVSCDHSNFKPTMYNTIRLKVEIGVKSWGVLNLQVTLSSDFSIASIFEKEVIYQKRVRVFHRGFQTQIVSRCSKALMKHEARVFGLAS